jgi:hypothetical protein
LKAIFVKGETKALVVFKALQVIPMVAKADTTDLSPFKHLEKAKFK